MILDTTDDQGPGRRWFTLLPFQIILALRISHQTPGNVSWQLMAAGLLGMDHWMPRKGMQGPG